MSVPEFSIPLSLGDLSEMEIGGQLRITENFTSTELRERLEQAKTMAQQEGPQFIVDYFSTFHSLLKNFKSLSDPLRQKGLHILLKSFQQLSRNLTVILEDGNLDTELQQRFCNIVKMLGYMLVEVVKCFQDKSTVNNILDIKGKKKTAKPTEDGFDWIEEKHNILIEIYNFLQLPLKLLWDPPVVEEEFVNLIANLCYKCLEDTTITAANSKNLRGTIFQIIATLIKHYQHGLGFCVKAVQMLRMQDHLVTPFAQGVVDMVNDGCVSVVRELVREISEVDEQLLADAAGARSIGQFLTSVAEGAPQAILPAVKFITAMLSRDPPTLRCSALSVLGEILQSTLTGENLDAEAKVERDSYLDILEEHIHDTNAFVRTRALQVWQKLNLAKAVPLARVNDLLEIIIGRLGDKSTYVKKQAVQLVKALLEGNPYSGQLDVNEIDTQLLEERNKLQTLMKVHKLNPDQSDWDSIESKLRKLLEKDDALSESCEELILEEAVSKIGTCLASGNLQKAVSILSQLKDEFYEKLGVEETDDVDSSIIVLKKIWEQQCPQELPELSADVLERKEALEKAISYLGGALDFAKLIDRALPLILTLLDSSAITDVLEAVSFFTAAFQFGFPRAMDGVRRILHLVFSKDTAVKSAVCNAYKQLYFETTATGRQHNLQVVKNLCSLIPQLDLIQLNALEEVVREWVQNDVVDNAIIQVLFERFSMKISGTTAVESWAALLLIAMIGAEKVKVIRSNVSVLMDHGFGSNRSLAFAQYACRALQKLPAENKLTADDDILIRVRRLLVEGLWSEDPYYVPFADEALILIFQLADRPEAIAEKLIIDLFTRLKEGRRPQVRNRNGRKLNQNANFEGGLIDCSEESELDTEIKVNDDHDGNNDGTNRTEKGATIVLCLTRFINLLGSVAAHLIGFLEGRILSELKRRNQVEFDRRLKRHDNSVADKSMDTEKEDYEFQRVMADDMNTMQLRKVTEEEVVNGEGLLAKFLPLLQTICRQPGKFQNEALQNATLLALGMFMQVSSKVCEDNIQLLVTITEKSQCVDKRRNGLLLLWALQFRYPNTLEPWTPHMFAMLRDPNATVRRTTVFVLTNLIVNEMVKVRSSIADLAASIVDEDTVIARTSRHFFREFSQKGNALFNVLPSLISSLTQPPNILEEEAFHQIMRFLMELVTKDRQQECLVEKLCQYFECANNDRQCRDLAFCLSLLQHSEKSLRKIFENFRCIGNKLYIAEVYEAFTSILTSAGRNPQKDKTLIEELTSLIEEYRGKSCDDRNVPVTVRKRQPASARKRVPRRKMLSSGSENEDDVEEKPIPRSTRKRAPPRRKLLSSCSEEEDEDDQFVKSRSARSRKNKRESADGSDSDGTIHKQMRSARKPAAVSRNRGRGRALDNSDSEEEVRQSTRSSARKKR